MKLVLAEKPSVAQSIAKVLGANKREDGYMEGNGYIVSWSYLLDKSRLSIRLQPPYSEERRRKASEYAKQNGFNKSY